VVSFAHAVIDAGADLVIGHGPHVPRALEVYNQRLVAYSLGNFCTYEGINIDNIKGYAPILSVQLAVDGAFISGRIISTYQQRPYGNRLDRQHRVAQLMRELTSADFPDGILKIDRQGYLSTSD
jgi:hypothetical protein